MNNDSRQEMKRALDIWRQKKLYEKDALLKLRRVTKKRNNRRMEDAFKMWERYCNELEYHCRIRVLHISFTRKAFLSHVF